MGFNVKLMTQDVHQGQFMINPEDPIPLMPYSDRFRWAKYGHFILYSGLIPKNKSSLRVHNKSLTVTHCECLISFLWTDFDGTASLVVDATSARRIDDFLKNTSRPLTKGTEKGYFFDVLMEKNADSFILSICVIAKEAAKNPLAIFTHCTRCQCAITRPDYIGRIMELAPMAMLRHLGIASDADDFTHCPLILPYPEVME